MKVYGWCGMVCSEGVVGVVWCVVRVWLMWGGVMWGGVW